MPTWAEFVRRIQWSRVIRGVLTATALSFLLMYFTIGLLRVWWPIPLDDLELAIVRHVRRVAMDRPLYAAPSVDFVPLVYTPLFYHVAAWFWAPLGGGFAPARLVSLAASFVLICLVALIVHHETRSWRAGFLGAALRAAVGGEIGRPVRASNGRFAGGRGGGRRPCLGSPR